MPNTQEENYEHIKALVRDLHYTQNVSRPEHLVNSSGNHVKHHHHASACKNVKNVSLAQKLIVHQLHPNENGPCHAIIENSEFYIGEEDETSDTNTSSLDISIVSPSNQSNSKHHNHFNVKGINNTLDANFTIPSLVITDVNEPVDLITSTQRRFSQLYSGLRRFSTSHTVGMATQNTKKKHILTPHTDQQHAIELCVLSDRCT